MVTREAVLLLTDVVESTSLTTRLGDARMAALWVEHDRLARRLLERWGGREVDRTDGFVLLFPAAASAAGFAADLHDGLSRLAAQEGVPFAARVVLHRGAVRVREEPGSTAKPIRVEGPGKELAGALLALGRGGQTLSTVDPRAPGGPAGVGTLPAAAAVHALGPHRLRGLAAPVELFELTLEGGLPRGLPPSARAWPVVRRGALWIPVERVPNNLPPELDPFFGREELLLRAEALLDQGAACLSLVGPGGVGKSRFARRLAWVRQREYPGGVWLVPCRGAAGPEGVAGAIARVLDLPLSGRDNVTQIGFALQAMGPSLLLLDGFEAAAPSASASLATWLPLAPEARFLLTSRVATGLPGEQVVAVPPLSVGGVEPGAQSEARALYESRALACAPGVSLDPEAVEALVARLHGLPQAVELAAARVAEASAAELCRRLEAAAEQDPMEAALDWTWSLLQPPQRAALMALSTFAAPVPLVALERVLADDAVLGGRQVWALLDDLLRHSLVTSVERPAEDALRFGLPAPVAGLARRRLVDPASLPGWSGEGVRRALEERHGRWFAAMGRSSSVPHDAAEQARRRSLVEWFADMVLAAERALERGDAAVAVGAVRAAWTVAELRGPRPPVGRLAAAVGALSTVEDRDRAWLLRVESIVAREHGELALAEARAEAGLELAIGLGDRRLEAWMRYAASAVAQQRGALEEASLQAERAEALADAVGEARLIAIVEVSLVKILGDRGEAEAARRRAEGALRRCQALGDQELLGLLLGNLAVIDIAEGRHALAAEHLALATDLHRSVGNLRDEGYALLNLGVLRFHEGAVKQGAEATAQALALARRIGDRRLTGIALANLGTFRAEEGELEVARALLREGCAVLAGIGNRRGAASTRRDLARLEARLGDPATAALILQDSIAVHEELGDPVEAARSEAALAEVRLALGQVEAAEEALARAVAQAAEKGLGPDSELGREIAAATARLGQPPPSR